MQIPDEYQGRFKSRNPELSDSDRFDSMTPHGVYTTLYLRWYQTQERLEAVFSSRLDERNRLKDELSRTRLDMEDADDWLETEDTHVNKKAVRELSQSRAEMERHRKEVRKKLAAVNQFLNEHIWAPLEDESQKLQFFWKTAFAPKTGVEHRP